MASKSSDWSIVLDATINVNSLQQSINQALKNKNLSLNFDSSSAGTVTKTLQGTTKALEDTADASNNAKKSMEETNLSFQAANEVFSRTLDILTSMVDQVLEVDTALTEFKKVSSLSGSALEDYTDQLAAVGEEFGRTRAAMIEGATEFKRSGFSDEDAATLAGVAAEFQNVSDGMVSTSEASEFIISQMKAYNMEVSDSTHVIDAVFICGYRVNCGELLRDIFTKLLW